MQLSAGGAEPVWSDSDEQLFRAWITEYVAFLENDPLPRYARVMANYIGTSFDEQLLACAMYLGECAPSTTLQLRGSCSPQACCPAAPALLRVASGSQVRGACAWRAHACKHV